MGPLASRLLETSGVPRESRCSEEHDRLQLVIVPYGTVYAQTGPVILFRLLFCVNQRFVVQGLFRRR